MKNLQRVRLMSEFYRLGNLLNRKKTGHPARFVYVTTGQTVREALNLMIQHDFSQLPVLHAKNKELVGVISFESIAKAVYRLNDPNLLEGKSVDVLGSKAEQCIEEAQPISKDKDIFDLLDIFAEKSYVLVGSQEDLEDVLTSYDVVHLFKEMAGHFLQIAEIERRIRSIIEKVLNTPELLSRAINIALDQLGESRPKTLEDMTLDNCRLLIVSKQNWPNFEPVFSDKQATNIRLTKLRNMRNDLFHFRLDTLDAGQKDFLEQSRYWIQKLEEKL